MVAFCSSPRFVDHITGPHHPERPDRIRAVARAVRLAGLVTSPDPFPEFELDLQLLPVGGPALLELTPVAAQESSLRLVHSQAHIDSIRHVCRNGGGVLDLGDTRVGPASFDVALLSCGAVLTCCDAVVGGQVKRAFAAVRPPGHHAEPDHPMGFCLFSNVAIAARLLQRKHGVGRVAIVDFDVHHGNGTQAVFDNDRSVLFVSLHQHPRTCYPGTGYEWETGSGTIVNVPMTPGAGDEAYLAAMRQRVLPAIDDFKPEILLISAGFDGHGEDPLAVMELSEDGFFQMTRLLTQAAETHCGGRIISALEGGYNLRELGRCVVRHLEALRS